MWISRFKQYSICEQENADNHELNANLAFTIPREYIIRQDLTTAALFHGGIDIPSVNAIDPILNSPVHITKYLNLKSKTSTQQYLNHLYERILITSNLSHPNVRRILSWYIADACLYSITTVIHRTLRDAIQSETFSLDRIFCLSLQIIRGTIYLQSRGLCPLTPWYTTNIELTLDDHIRLCSPTISTTKLNGGTVQHHHLWRHAPETLIRMIIDQDPFVNDKAIDNSKEDVWSIGCIIIEMLINTILFRPQNDEPSLQLLHIVRYVGGLTQSIFHHFPQHVQQLYAKVEFDTDQRRLHDLLMRIFSQQQIHFNAHQQYAKENLFDLLQNIFQFQSDKRISLQSLIEHPFYSSNPSSEHYRCGIDSSRLLLPLKTPPIRNDDLIHLCIKLNSSQSRWVLSLKERCLFEFLLNVKSLKHVHLSNCRLSQTLQIEIKRLIYFFTRD